MENTKMSTKVRAIILMKGEEITLPYSEPTAELLVGTLKKHGFKFKNIHRMETFNVLKEKRRGRTKSKY